MFWFKIPQTIYNKIDWDWAIVFKTEEEKMLFGKYLELWEKNWWSSNIERLKWGWSMTNVSEYSPYQNVEIWHIGILWVEWATGSAKREWDNWHIYLREFRNFSFDILENEDAVKYIFKEAKKYQDKLDAIAKAEADAIEEKKRIEHEHKMELENIIAYTKRINELNGSSWEFDKQFEIIREIEWIWELNKKLLVSWEENVEKINKLKSNFYNL